jgi:lauroyl/myristoyl acyltransferase
VRGNLIYVLYRLLATLAGRLPPRAGYWLARQAGRLLYVLDPGLKRIVRSNLRHVLGPGADNAEVEATTRQALINIAKGHYDLFRVSRLSVAEIRRLIQVEGMEHLQRALARGRGAIVFSAHVGNVDLVGQLPMAYDLKISGAAEHIQPERLFRYLRKLRQSHGLQLIPSDEPMIGLIRALRRGEIIALPVDRDVTGSGPRIEFFDKATHLPDGPVRLALRTGAPILPAFVLRLPDERFRVEIGPPLDLQRTGDLQADVRAGMKQMIALLEQHISRQPEQWLVASPVWPLDGRSPQR